MSLRSAGVLALLAAAVMPGQPLSAQAASPRKIIRKISIEGLRRESEVDILSRLQIRIGDDYDPEKVDAETGNLWRMNKFQKVDRPQVSEFEDGWSIRFVVEERTRVVSVQFQGRDALSESRLTTTPPSLRTRAGGLLNETQVRQDRDIIQEKYLEAGYLFAQVRTEIAQSPQGATVKFVIDEGSRVRIREIRFSGNKVMTSGTLLGLMQTREKDFWFFGLIRPGFYEAGNLDTDMRRIEDHYQRFGYFDAKAQLRGTEFDPWKERLILEVLIREGPQYTFAGYRLKGNAVFRQETLLGLTRAQPGQPFNRDVVEADEKAITDHYFNRAYVFARVKPRLEFSYETQEVWVWFEIEEKNQISIEEVRIRGNVLTQDTVIRRELEFYPGEKVDWSRFEESRSNLNRLGLFRNVDFTFEEGSAPDKKDVVVRFDEEQFGRLYLQFGVSSDLGLIGLIRIRKNNFDIADLPDSPNPLDIPSSFTGAGQTFVLELQPGTEYSRYRVQFVEPYLFGTRNALGLSLSHLTIRWDGYDETRSSFAPRISHAFSFDRDFVVSLGYRIERVKIDEIDSDAPQDVRDAEGYSTVSALSPGLSHDKVLHEFLEGPYSGTSYSLLYEYAGGFLGGDVDFHKGFATTELYYPLYTIKDGPNRYHHVVMLSGNFGIIEPHGSEADIPIFERFYLGGLRANERVRGFDYRGLGPHDAGEPIGGTTSLFGTLEYSFPIFQKLLRGVIWLDYGNLASSFDSFSLSEMRVAAGGGFRINFPLPGQPFPLAFYLGYPIRQLDEDESRVFLFTIGSPF